MQEDHSAESTEWERGSEERNVAIGHDHFEVVVE